MAHPQSLTATAELTVTFRVSTGSPEATAVAEHIIRSLNAAFNSPAAPSAQVEPFRPRLVVAQPESAVHLHVPSRTARLRGTPLALTRLEFDLLLHLGRGRGRVFTREELMAEVWPGGGGPGSRTVDVHIRRLRAKFGPGQWIITTVRGIGYRIDATAALTIDDVED